LKIIGHGDQESMLREKASSTSYKQEYLSFPNNKKLEVTSKNILKSDEKIARSSIKLCYNKRALYGDRNVAAKATRHGVAFLMPENRR
jgi:hypothetical protein